MAKNKRWVMEPKSGLEALQLVDEAIPEPGAGELLVRMRAMSLNYRDLLLAKRAADSGADGSKSPLSDGVGEIVAVGEGVDDKRVGERVIGSFFRTWRDGPFDIRYHDQALGGSASGVAAEYVVLRADGVVRVPDGVSDETAASLPCAGLTAWNALFESGDTRPGETVVVEGTGGVSIIGLQLARVAGARVIVTSSSNDKLARARALGADVAINYATSPKWGSDVQKQTGGAHNVLDVGGPGTFDQATAALRSRGIVSLIGVLTGFGGPINTYAIIHAALRVHGIYVGSTAMLHRLVQTVATHAIAPPIDRTFGFGELREAYAHLQSATHFGKVIVKL